MKVFMKNRLFVLLLAADLCIMYILSSGNLDPFYKYLNDYDLTYYKDINAVKENEVVKYIEGEIDTDRVYEEVIEDIDNTYFDNKKLASFFEQKEFIKSVNSYSIENTISSNTFDLPNIIEFAFCTSTENLYQVPQLTSSVSVNFTEELYQANFLYNLAEFSEHEEYSIDYMDAKNINNETDYNLQDTINENVYENSYFNGNNLDSNKNEVEEVSSKSNSKEHIIEIIDGITYIDGIMIVNKTYCLPEDYNPGDLLPEVKKAFALMQEDAAIEGLKIYISSGYRSYKRQAYLHEKYSRRDGEEKADTYSARAGYSEHQTGLCIDLNSISDSFSETPEAKWVEEHAHEYGFIVRFPEGKEELTGYKYESWHLRYIGVEKATEVYQSGLCLEEFLGISSVYID